VSAEVTELKRIYYYPKDNDDYYFRPIVDLTVLDNMAYGIANLNNKAIAFKIEFPKINYAFDIGMPGQGTGDLLHPITLSIWNDEIAIKESGFFSFFEKTGKYLSKFRIFSSHPAFTFLDNKIYWLNPNLKDSYLFEIYGKNGERISTFGTKFPNVDIHAFKNPIRIQNQLYQGKLLSNGKSIFYFNSRFGKYYIFSLDGKTLSEGDISKHFGERGKKIKEYNNKLFIERVKNQEKKTSGYPLPLIFKDSYLYKDRLYFISSTLSEEKGEKTTFKLRILSIKSMILLEEYIIRRENFCRLDSLAVVEENGKDYILIAITDFEEGHFLELYK